MSTVHEPFDKGCGPDLVHLSIVGGPLAGDTLRTVGGRVDHMGKVFDGHDDADPVRTKYFGIFTSDGGRARRLRDDVQRRRCSAGGGWRFPSRSCSRSASRPKSCAAPVRGHRGHGTGLDPGDAHPDRLFTCDSTGAFSEFRIDPSTGSPLPARRFTPDPAVVNGVTEGWTYSYPPDASGLPVYSNDVAFADLGPADSDKWVLVDLTNHFLELGDGGVSSQVLLLAYQWDPPTSSWVNRAAVSASPFHGSFLSMAMATTIQGGRHYAIVCHGLGFDVFEIERLLDPVPHMTWWPNAAVRPGAGIVGIAVAGDRVFASVPASGGLPDRIEMYTWSGATPEPAAQRFPEPSFVEPLTGLVAIRLGVPRAPWPARRRRLGRPVRLRRLLQYGWIRRGSRSSPLGTGASYGGAIADCRMHEFLRFLRTGVLVLKSDDSFAIVNPVRRRG